MQALINNLIQPFFVVIALANWALGEHSLVQMKQNN